jgi:hypothetical protein
MLRLDSEQKVKDSNSELLQLYHTLFDDECVDVKLIVALVTLIHSENTKGYKMFYLHSYLTKKKNNNSPIKIKDSLRLSITNKIIYILADHDIIKSYIRLI